jgi:hypothetical protein
MKAFVYDKTHSLEDFAIKLVEWIQDGARLAHVVLRVIACYRQQPPAVRTPLSMFGQGLRPVYMANPGFALPTRPMCFDSNSDCAYPPTTSTSGIFWRSIT